MSAAAVACTTGHLRPAAEVATAALAWTGAYRLAGRCAPGRAPEWSCRLVTAGHACLVSALAAWDVFALGRNAGAHANQGLPYNSIERLTFTICLGYFLFDLAWCLSHRSEGPLMLFHHCASIIGLTLSLFMCRWAPELIATIGGTEVTNPLLQLRWFLLHGGGTTSWRLLAAVEACFLAVFFVMRILIGGCLTVSYLTNPATDWLGRLGAVTMFGIGVAFFVQLCAYAFRRRSRKTGGGRSRGDDVAMGDVNGHKTR